MAGRSTTSHDPDHMCSATGRWFWDVAGSPDSFFVFFVEISGSTKRRWSGPKQRQRSMAPWKAVLKDDQILAAMTHESYAESHLGS